MNHDISWLVASIFLGLAYVFIAAGFATRQRGIKWNASNRDGQMEPLQGHAARAARANTNFLESFPFFAAAVLAASVIHRNSPHTVLGEQIYFFARVVYLPVYIVGIPYLRTAIWVASFWGLLQVLEALF